MKKNLKELLNSIWGWNGQTEFSEMLGVNIRTVVRWCAENRIPAINKRNALEKLSSAINTRRLDLDAADRIIRQELNKGE